MIVVRRGRAGPLAAAAALGLLATACAHAAPAAPPAPVPPGLERFYSQQLSWGACEGFTTSDADEGLLTQDGLECSRLEVPLDYAAPTGRTARIAVLRHSTSQNRIGSLVVNPGGPGGSGIQAAAGLAGPLGDGPFDIVGFDPRGVGASTPKLDCLTDAEFVLERADVDLDPSPAGVARADAETAAYVAKCVERSGGVEVLANAGTRDVARDLDVLRAALGDRLLTYLGYSYGTSIGSTYAEMFPGNVRALVLDGAVDPTQSAVDSTVAQRAGFQAAFDVYAADCARAADCPLGTDPAAATAAFQALTRPLLTTPLPVAGGRTLSYPDAIIGAISALYRSAAWPDLSEGLRTLQSGDGASLLRLADSYYTLDVDVLVAVNCVDKDRITDRAATADAARRALAAAPFADPGIGVTDALDTCALWPVPPTSTPHLPVAPGLPPTLVVSTTGDPATPYAAGAALAQALGGSLLTVEGTQHTVVAGGHSCVDSIVAEYLVELTLPTAGARCILPVPTTEGAPS